MSKRKESLSLSDGYFGDCDSESRSIDECSSDKDFVIDNVPPSPFFAVHRYNRNRRKKQSRKRKLKYEQSNRTVATFAIENPRHPDIDVSLTRHVPSHQFKTHIVPANEATTSSKQNRKRKLKYEQSNRTVATFAIENPRHPDIDVSLTRHVLSPQFKANIVPANEPANSSIFLESQPAYRVLERLCASKSGHQHQAIEETATKEDGQITTVEALGSLPLISCHNMQLEDALSFTRCPRILIQADYPYNIVYTNAAYAEMKSKTNEDNRYLPLFQETDRTRATITSLFEPSEKVTVFPVWRGEMSHRKGCLPSLTHFLFEGNYQGKQSHLINERAVEECQTQVIG